ncbi:hypothetical protein DCAR_0727945 [Daucus carota subsp. sativus]|uniref:Epidermal patterning factor-like protein n=1 Tax=Daucus carota subsp. sativus TaxID=79200 RepID=A0A164T4R2_DAUCS|nr:PREDICTED: EPIDERMAL PATTERNING FACTOR-like protein 5 [Daucus carota subsp. sativus]WOH08504.1 hypothetical protein DCAR_0727945 [Daucus carota subsp. sativus]
MAFLHRRLISSAALLFLIFASSAAATRTPTHRKLGGQDSSGSLEILERVMITRRRLSGLGSWPPSCRSKCESCSPCNPVHVPVHPGFTIPLEYYPEAWRCKCRNKTYKP